MRVVFLSPTYPPEMRQFTRGLAEVGTEVLGVGEGSPDPALQRYLADYLQVPAIMDEEDVLARVRAWLRGRNQVVVACTQRTLSDSLGFHGY